jgi:hypothetical protein
MPKIELSTGKVVAVHEKRDMAAEYKALKLCGASAATQAGGETRVSLAETMLTAIAYTAVMVVSVDGKGFSDLADGVTGEDLLLSFRAAFTDGEWTELERALQEIAPDKAAAAPGKYRISFT